MYDLELVREILQRLHSATQTIKKRFRPVEVPDDFTSSEQGSEKLDAISVCADHIDELAQTLRRILDDLPRAEGGDE